MDIIILIAGVCAGLFLLLRSGDALVNGASALALNFKLSSVFVGIVIVGFGTSMPEVMATLSAARAGEDALALGNILGSNLANMGIIFSLALLLVPSAQELLGLKRDITLMLIGTLVFTGIILFLPAISAPIGIALLAGLVVYLYLSFTFATKAPQPNASPAEITLGIPMAVFLVIVGLLGLAFGAEVLVHNATGLARLLNVPEKIIGLTLIAVGTSLPELASTIAAARQHNLKLITGNILGSNIFNILGAAGISAIVHPISTATFQQNMLIVLLFSIIILPLFFWKKAPHKIWGVVLGAGYLGYLWYII